MAIVDGSLQLGYKDSAWFTANDSVVLLVGQIVYLEQTGTYKIGDGVTALSALSFLGGLSTTPTLQQVITESPTVSGVVAQSASGNSEIRLDTDTIVQRFDNGVNYSTITVDNDAILIDVDTSSISVSGASIDVNAPAFTYNGTQVATLNNIGTNYTQKFTHTGLAYALTVAPTFIYSIRTTTMILDETDVNDVTIVGTTLTVTNPNFIAGETLYIKYKG